MTVWSLTLSYLFFPPPPPPLLREDPPLLLSEAPPLLPREAPPLLLDLPHHCCGSRTAALLAAIARRTFASALARSAQTALFPPATTGVARLRFSTTFITSATTERRWSEASHRLYHLHPRRSPVRLMSLPLARTRNPAAHTSCLLTDSDTGRPFGVPGYAANSDSCRPPPSSDISGNYCNCSA